MHWPAPLVATEPEPDRGPVMVQLEYHVDPQKLEQFLAIMPSYRQMRRRDGAFYWGLFRDIADPARFVECFLVESWLEHLRQHERVTVADRQVQDELKRCLVGEGQPRLAHYLAESIPRKQRV
jgi:hypothetical protein